MQRNTPERPFEQAPVHAEALWYVAPGKLEIRREALPLPAQGELRVRTLFSGVSRGTESLVFRGAVPQSEWQRMRAPFQAGDFPFPVKYGYACVGLAEANGPSAAGRPVFVLHPHQDLFNAPVGSLLPIPDGIPAARAVLAANLETALNGLWDGSPSPGDQITVVGGGVVGLLAGWLAASIPATSVTLVDVNPKREALAHTLGMRFAVPDKAAGDQDLVIHASGHPDGLDTALELAGTEATVLEMSWYGEAPVSAHLGRAFHSRRLTLKSSQVGRIPAHRQARWTFRRRMEAALSLLRDDRLDALLEPAIPFHKLTQELPAVLSGERDALAQVVTYP
ncbi:dehydrogenase [Stappia sp. GBMRC 2046]|uniref:Dehydrogenase n=1 Tax=Stappia sediminis TaxID=2692190 RepID=A0A7X3LX05_9HYPH|nr:zinc-binding alcohol dehydrogenase [Stappia sediminis]MXN66603.1 dehydrogenase [Stappia sediminis]